MEIKTVNDLRKVLAEQINRVRSGKSTPAQSNAITNATGKILSSIRMEIDYAKLIGETPHIDFIPSNKPELENNPAS